MKPLICLLLLLSLCGCESKTKDLAIEITIVGFETGYLRGVRSVWQNPYSTPKEIMILKDIEVLKYRVEIEKVWEEK